MSGGATRVEVIETFVSLQGEGLMTGVPCFFVRLAGCNLRCVYCDTIYARGEGRARSMASLVDEWKETGVELAQVTGGEPLHQEGSLPLMAALQEAGAYVLLETNGSFSLSAVPPGVMKVVDRKTPGSGMSRFWCEENTRYLDEKDQIKFVICSRGDYEWAMRETARLKEKAAAQFLFAPAWGALRSADLAEWIVEDRLRVRFQLQLHKVLWGDKRGV